MIPPFQLVNIKGKWVNPFRIAAIDVWISYAEDEDAVTQILGSRIVLTDVHSNNFLNIPGLPPDDVAQIIKAAWSENAGVKYRGSE